MIGGRAAGLGGWSAGGLAGGRERKPAAEPAADQPAGRRRASAYGRRRSWGTLTVTLLVLRLAASSRHSTWIV